MPLSLKELEKTCSKVSLPLIFEGVLSRMDEILEVVQGKTALIVDGGFRRGNEIHSLIILEYKTEGISSSSREHLQVEKGGAMKEIIQTASA